MREHLSPPALTFSAQTNRLPFEVQEGGEYELIFWGNAVVFHSSNYVGGTRPWLLINRVPYHVRVDLVLTEGGLYQPNPEHPYRAVSIDRANDFTNGLSNYSSAAKRKAEETLIPFINDVCREHPELVDAWHRTRLNNDIWSAEQEYARKKKELDDVYQKLRKAQRNERTYIATKGQPA